jgi:hypothetical protein
MTFILIVGLGTWLFLGCGVARVIGNASDLGRLPEGSPGTLPTGLSNRLF